MFVVIGCLVAGSAPPACRVPASAGSAPSDAAAAAAVAAPRTARRGSLAIVDPSRWSAQRTVGTTVETDSRYHPSGGTYGPHCGPELWSRHDGIDRRRMVGH